mgnify:CR=1 FL=1
MNDIEARMCNNGRTVWRRASAMFAILVVLGMTSLAWADIFIPTNLGGIALGRDCRSVARDVANSQREPTFVQPSWKVTGRVPG